MVLQSLFPYTYNVTKKQHHPSQLFSSSSSEPRCRKAMTIEEWVEINYERKVLYIASAFLNGMN